MSICPTCGVDEAELEAMKEIVVAADLLIDASRGWPFSREAVALAGSLLARRVNGYRGNTESTNEGEEN